MNEPINPHIQPADQPGHASQPNNPYAGIFQSPSQRGTPDQAPAAPSTIFAVPPMKPSIPVPFDGIDTLFALLTLLGGCLFIWLVNWFHLGIGVPLFTLYFCVLALCYFRHRGIPPARSSFVILCLMLFSAANFTVIANNMLKTLNLLFLMLLAVYWVGSIASTRMEPKLGQYLGSDLINHIFVIPFRNFGCGGKIIKENVKKSSKSKTLLFTFIGILISIPLLGVIIGLLMQADGAFEQMMRNITDHLGRWLWEFVWRLPLSILVACYLFGLLYGTAHKRLTKTMTVSGIQSARKNRKILPFPLVATVLSLLCAVYVLFFIAQSSTLFTAFSNMRPDGTTYAEFARRGFFELCAVAAINLVVNIVVLVFSSYSEKTLPPVLKALNILLCCETLLLIITAISKMALYIRNYGLTPKRVYTSWFMVLLFAVFVLLIAGQFKKFNFVKSLSITFSVLFLVLCWSNVDSLIASYNINRYTAGTLQELDVDALYQIRDAAKPQALKLYNKLSADDPLREELAQLLRSGRYYYEESSFQSFNIQEMRAFQITKEFIQANGNE